MIILAIIPGVALVAGLMLMLSDETREGAWLLGVFILGFAALSLLFALATAAIIDTLEKRR